MLGSAAHDLLRHLGAIFADEGDAAIFADSCELPLPPLGLLLHYQGHLVVHTWLVLEVVPQLPWRDVRLLGRSLGLR